MGTPVESSTQISTKNDPKYWYFTPEVPIYTVTPIFYAIDIEEIALGFILKVF